MKKPAAAQRRWWQLLPSRKMLPPASILFAGQRRREGDDSPPGRSPAGVVGLRLSRMRGRGQAVGLLNESPETVKGETRGESDVYALGEIGLRQIYERRALSM